MRISSFPVLFCAILLWGAAALTAQTWTVSTVLPTNSGVSDAVIVDGRGTIYMSDWGRPNGLAGTRVFRLDAQGVFGEFATGLNRPNGLAIGANDTLYIANSYGRTIEKVSPDGVRTTFLNEPDVGGVVFSRNLDTLYYCSYVRNDIHALPMDGSAPVVIASGSGDGLSGPVGMILDDAGRLYVANFDAPGTVLHVAAGRAPVPVGDIPGGAGFIAWADGAIYGTAFARNRIYRIDLDGTVTAIAGSGIPGSSDGPALSARFNGPNGIAATAGGDTLYVTDFFSRSLRMIVRDPATALGDRPDILPGSIELTGAYPNPFNPSTTIAFQLPRRMAVRLTVYDVVGREVARLVDATMDAGSHAARFQPGPEAASGVFVYRLEADGRIFSGKLTLVR